MATHHDPLVRRNIRITVAVALTFALITVAALVNKLSQPRILNQYELRDYGAYLLDSPRATDAIALIDHKGQAYTEARLPGSWTLVFFGFSHCADICPTTMATLAKMYQELKPKEKADLNVVLISVDPERDTPQVLADYVKQFNPDFTGVTGEAAQIKQLSLQWNTGFEAPADDNTADSENYQVAHSSSLVLLNPKGELHGFIRPPLEHGSLRVLWRSIRTTY
ncbi:MAG: SCO family protein [Porticoccaceae bacterium]|nr:SCO family protein [Porticoccaceae bacterium]